MRPLFSETSVAAVRLIVAVILCSYDFYRFPIQRAYVSSPDNKNWPLAG